MRPVRQNVTIVIDELCAALNITTLRLGAAAASSYGECHCAAEASWVAAM
jgi:hypothetical protein